MVSVLRRNKVDGKESIAAYKRGLRFWRMAELLSIRGYSYGLYSYGRAPLDTRSVRMCVACMLACVLACGLACVRSCVRALRCVASTWLCRHSTITSPPSRWRLHTQLCTIRHAPCAAHMPGAHARTHACTQDLCQEGSWSLRYAELNLHGAWHLGSSPACLPVHAHACVQVFGATNGSSATEVDE